MPLDPFLQQSQESVQATQGTLDPGQRAFGGRYVLERHLGQGGMGQVWLAQDTTLDEPRALKFVLPALLSDATARKRLRNEARLGTHLAHPRIVRVFDFAEETNGSPLAAVVMEYVAGRTLNELLAEQEIGFFEPEEIETWVQDIIEGLRYAHEEKQRFHLDLKPGNIVIETATGRAKLLDFGISRSAKDTITRLTGQVSSGTLPYMSPQQLDGEPPCAADDVYGLGATVYELLTGTPPFFRGKLEDQIRSKEPEPIMNRRRQNAKEGLNAGISGDVDDAASRKVLLCLGKEKKQRRSIRDVFGDKIASFSNKSHVAVTELINRSHSHQELRHASKELPQNNTPDKTWTKRLWWCAYFMQAVMLVCCVFFATIEGPFSIKRHNIRASNEASSAGSEYEFIAMAERLIMICGIYSVFFLFGVIAPSFFRRDHQPVSRWPSICVLLSPLGGVISVLALPLTILTGDLEAVIGIGLLMLPYCIQSIAAWIRLRSSSQSQPA